MISAGDALRPGGLRPRTKACCPIRGRSFVGYGLLQEYFCFPQKFFFLDLTGLDRVGAARFRRAAPKSSS